MLKLLKPFIWQYVVILQWVLQEFRLWICWQRGQKVHLPPLPLRSEELIFWQRHCPTSGPINMGWHSVFFSLVHPSVFGTKVPCSTLPGQGNHVLGQTGAGVFETLCWTQLCQEHFPNIHLPSFPGDRGLVGLGSCGHHWSLWEHCRLWALPQCWGCFHRGLDAAVPHGHHLVGKTDTTVSTCLPSPNSFVYQEGSTELWAPFLSWSKSFVHFWLLLNE